MSIAAKTVLMKSIEEQLSDTLTVSQLNSVMGTVSSRLEEYEVEHSESGGMNAGSEEMLSAFLAAKEIEGRSERTIERYRYVLNRMLSAIPAPVSKINVFHLRKYLMDLKAAGNAERTLDGYRNIFNSFFGWLTNEGLIARNPAVNIAAIKSVKKVRLPFSDVDIALMNESCESERDTAIVFFLLATGCRISEVCALNRADVDLKNMECTVFGKGAKERTVYLNEVAAFMLNRYLYSRADSSPALFVGKGTERMTPGGIRFMLKSLEKKSGVENIHPHRFRRTLATTLINHGMPIQEVAAILGHDKIDTTMKYVFIAKENVRNSYRKFA